MPAPGKQSPSSPATDRQPRLTPARAEALRWWRAGYQAGHQAAEREQQAAARRNQTAASRQAKIDALLLETIDALARLLNGDHPGNGTA